MYRNEGTVIFFMMHSSEWIIITEKNNLAILFFKWLQNCIT